MPKPNHPFHFLALVKRKLWRLIDGFNNDELYVLKISDVFQKFLEYRIDDIEEFAVIYTYEYHERQGKLDDLESKQKMYSEVLGIMQELKEKGRLNG